MTTTTTQDLAIKLFGSTIPLPHSHSQISLSIPNPLLNLDARNDLRKAEQSVSGTENYCPSERSSVLGDNEENQASNVTNKEELDLRSKEEQANGNCSEQERIFKKPDKIIPCPRCNSLETKFCYFNNYNVNQPRHFCKNCQRYWTAGGTMRNVPIGAGRRRNKQLASQYRQIIVSSEGVATTRLETSDSTNHHQLISCVESSSTTLRPSTGHGTVLKFGPEAPICESMETVLSLGDQKRVMEIGSAYCGDSPEEPSSCGSSMTTASIRGNELPKNVVEREAVRLSGSCSEITASNTMHHYPVPQLVFPMNQGGNGMVSSAVAQGSDCTSIPNASNHPNPVQWLPATMLAVPGFCTPSLPLQFMPASCWGCTPVWSGGAGNLAVPSNGCASQTSPPAANGCCPTNPNPIPTLGKHSRDANSLAEEEKSKKCVVVPKTLRVDNPSEASRSPIWATLGIRPYQKETISSSTVFETSETNVDVKSQFMDASPILGAKTSSFYSHL